VAVPESSRGRRLRPVTPRWRYRGHKLAGSGSTARIGRRWPRVDLRDVRSALVLPRRRWPGPSTGRP